MNCINRIILAAMLPAFLLATPVFAQTGTLDQLEAEVKSDGSDMKNDGSDMKKMEADKAAAEFVVRMKNNKFLRGVPVDLALIDVFILGTKIPVPLDQVVGIRFAATPEENGTVALKNGEMLSGRIDPPTVVLSVEWGEAKINPNVVSSMVRDGSMQWSVRNTPNGPQWFLAPRGNRTINRSSSYTPVQGNPVSTATASPDSWASSSVGESSYSINTKEFSWIW